MCVPKVMESYSRYICVFASKVKILITKGALVLYFLINSDTICLIVFDIQRSPLRLLLLFARDKFFLCELLR